MEGTYTILIPTRPQPDTIAAIFMLKAFGEARFPGIGSGTLSVKVSPQLPEGESFETLIVKNIIPLDVGSGPLDHHTTGSCSSELVAKYLGIEKDPAVAQLLAWANRDDKFGKGTISKDPLDRAFGLSGVIAALNKTLIGDPDKIVHTVLPLIEAHYTSAREHHVELPQDIERKRATGEYEEIEVRVGKKTLKIACVVSDKPSMPTYLRSSAGPRTDVVLQKSEITNHFCILSRQENRIDLSLVAALIRMREGQLRGIDMGEDPTILGGNGRIDAVPMWYVDPATNSILNGGPHAPEIEESRIPWEEMKQIVPAGLTLVHRE